jgi:hypothetical protein
LPKKCIQFGDRRLKKLSSAFKVVTAPVLALPDFYKPGRLGKGGE